MIPFVAAGGILIALGFLFGGDEVVTKLYGGTYHGVKYTDVASSFPLGFTNGNIDQLIGQAGYAGLLFVIGKIAFFMLVPILSGFIAFAIADRPGLVPGVVSGLISSAIGAGFLGGLIGGLLAGFVALYLSRIKVPKAVRGVMPVVVIPLFSTLIMGVDHVRGHQQAGDLGADAPDQLAEQPVRLQRDPARPAARRHDGLRHGRPGQQDGLHVRGHRVELRRQCHARLGAEDHGRRHGRRHGAAVGSGPGHRRSASACSPRPRSRTAGPPGCWAPRSSPRAPSRSPRPTRSGSSRRSCSAVRSPAASRWRSTTNSGLRTAASSSSDWSADRCSTCSPSRSAPSCPPRRSSPSRACTTARRPTTRIEAISAQAATTGRLIALHPSPTASKATRRLTWQNAA